RHAGEELGALEVVHRGEARHLRARDAGFGVDLAVAQLRAVRSGVHQDHGAAPAAVAHQQVGAQADEEQRLPFRQLAQERPQVVDIGRHIDAVRAPAGAPADVAGHRLVEPQVTEQLAEAEGFGHVHCSCAGTPPIEPAPMVMTTSRSSAARRMASGMAAISSTNKGSTFPATRTARASERPSAATIGGSPAAYTSASTSTSTVDSTRTKSSNRSRVRV